MGELIDKQLSKLGKIENLASSMEGIVFEYPPGSDKIYKLTGDFAMANQIIGRARRSGMTEDEEPELEVIEEEKAISEADLLEDLSASAKAINLPPIADAGEDKTISSEEDNTAIILLDGSRSYDPDGKIQSYAWQDSKGNIIGESAQVRVRLPLGTHPFELTVVDDKGAATKAIVTVRIQ